MDEPFCARLEVITPHFIVYLFKETNCLACSCIKRTLHLVAPVFASLFFFFHWNSCDQSTRNTIPQSTEKQFGRCHRCRRRRCRRRQMHTPRTFTHDMKTKRFKGIVFRLSQITFSLVLLYRWRPPLPFGFRQPPYLRYNTVPNANRWYARNPYFFLILFFTGNHSIPHWNCLKFILDSVSSWMWNGNRRQHECASAFGENLFLAKDIIIIGESKWP